MSTWYMPIACPLSSGCLTKASHSLFKRILLYSIHLLVSVSVVTLYPRQVAVGIEKLPQISIIMHARCKI